MNLGLEASTDFIHEDAFNRGPLNEIMHFYSRSSSFVYQAKKPDINLGLSRFSSYNGLPDDFAQ